MPESTGLIDRSNSYDKPLNKKVLLHEELDMYMMPWMYSVPE
jgi:hypothetical protein